MSEEIKSLWDCLARWESQKPDTVAYRVLGKDGIDTIEQITYKSLAFQARKLAIQLQKKHPPQSRVILFYPTSLDFIVAMFACFYANMIAVPVYPPVPFSKRFFPHLQTMIDIMCDCGASCILTHKQGSRLLAWARLRLRMKRWFRLGDARVCFSRQAYHAIMQTKVWDSAYLLNKPFVMDVDAGLEKQQDFDNNDRIAYLQYTSGSTGKPKGVMVTHANLMNNSQHIAVIFPDTLQNYVSWLPLYHDMGIMNGLFLPMLLGVASQLLSPMDFVANPLSWLQAISAFPNCASGAPQFGYALCQKKIMPQQMQNLDLSHWLLAYCGAEKNQLSVLEGFSKKFSPYGFRYDRLVPCYGLAEATVGVSGLPLRDEMTVLSYDKNRMREGVIVLSDQDDCMDIIGVGQWFPDHDLIIVNTENYEKCDDLTLGEIWLHGASVCLGYWNNPLSSSIHFQAYTQSGKGPYLRTGDLGFIYQSELFVCERIKDLIIIRGRNYHPINIEYAVSRCDPNIRLGSVCALAHTHNDEERLVLLVELKDISKKMTKLSMMDILQHIREVCSENFALRAYDIVLLKPGEILKTSSGKIRRKACHTRYCDKDFQAWAHSLGGKHLEWLCGDKAKRNYFSDCSN